MVLRAIFLDMDHTLCDTTKADQLGVQDFQQALASDFEKPTAERIGEDYLKVIYGKNRNVPSWQKIESESETKYRARLLEKTIQQETTQKLSGEKLSTYARLFMDLRIKHFRFFPGAEEMLHKLRKKYCLILITNGPLFSQQPKIEKVEMARHVDEIILGGSLPYEKPHPSIFTLACKKAKCLPAEAIHVGDSLGADIQGAKNANITSVWLTPDPSQVPVVPQPDYIIKNICEVEKLVECMG